MKRKFFSYFLLSIVFVMGMMVSCTKEGPAGKDGAPGKDGEDGINGQDGTATCVQCHDNSQVKFAKTLQWEASVHATGGNFERNDADCAACHTSQGFLQRMANGTMEADGTVENPNPQNCYTCHNIHSTYTPDDWGFTYNAPVKLWINDETVDFGKGNLCINCHQARIPDPFPVVGGSDVEIGSPYWGAHHGPQGLILGGTGAFEIGDGYSNGLHTTLVTDGCVTCHMATAYGTQAGGHTMNITYMYHGHEVINTAGCISCHTDASALNDKIEATQTEFDELLATLGDLLIAQGIMDENFRAIPGTMTATQAGVLMNFNMVREDGSHGVHNGNYVRAILNNSIAAMQ
ncbi:MAG: hypothetical protein GXO88_11970 [Chlorobi bacterium]|nr:hypothetical protein [Chlorobiota bacterium]